MLACATFWLLLCLPGYALLKRFAPSLLDGGTLSGVALGYVASFALLSPVSIVGYLFSLPLATLSVAIVVCVLVAVAWLVRDLLRAWQWRWLLPRPLALLVASVIVTDMLMGLRAGSYFTGDAHYHLARVRMLLSFGFNSWDPMTPGPRLDTVYHSNLYHALMAASAQLSGQHAPEAWAYALFWAKLMGAAATYHLAWVMFGQRWLAWSAACMIAIFLAPSSMLTYPNSITVYGLLPLVLAFAVEAWVGERNLLPALGLGALAVVLVEFHALYYLFACLLAAPILIGGLVRVRLQRLPGQRQLLLALLALGLGTPWFAIRALPRLQAARRPPAVAAVASAPANAPATTPTAVAPAEPEFPEPTWSYKGFVRLEHGRLMLDPSPLRDPHSQYFQVLLAVLAGGLSRRRSRFLALGLALATVVVVLYVPVVCTAFDHALGAAWIVKRLAAVLNATHLALFPGVFGLLIAERLRPGAHFAWHALVQTLALCAAVTYSYAFGLDAKPWTRRGYIASARTGAPLSKLLDRMAHQREFFEQNIRRKSIVAVSKTSLYDLMMGCDCFPLSIPSTRGSHGVADMPQRRAATSQLFDARTPLDARIATIRRYRVRHLYARKRSFSPLMMRTYLPIAKKVATLGGDELLVLDARQLR